MCNCNDVIIILIIKKIHSNDCPVTDLTFFRLATEKVDSQHFHIFVYNCTVLR